MADFDMQALKAENAMLIELLKKNGIQIPTANPSVIQDVTGEKKVSEHPWRSGRRFRGGV